jgi:hypothetical protein
VKLVRREVLASDPYGVVGYVVNPVRTTLEILKFEIYPGKYPPGELP